MTEPVIEVIDVVKSLGQGAGTVQAVKGVNLSVGAGELTLVMGPSGSGKCPWPIHGGAWSGRTRQDKAPAHRVCVSIVPPVSDLDCA